MFEPLNLPGGQVVSMIPSIVRKNSDLLVESVCVGLNHISICFTVLSHASTVIIVIDIVAFDTDLETYFEINAFMSSVLNGMKTELPNTLVAYCKSKVILMKFYSRQGSSKSDGYELFFIAAEASGTCILWRLSNDTATWRESGRFNCCTPLYQIIACSYHYESNLFVWAEQHLKHNVINIRQVGLKDIEDNNSTKGKSIQSFKENSCSSIITLSTANDMNHDTSNSAYSSVIIHVVSNGFWVIAVQSVHYCCLVTGRVMSLTLPAPAVTTPVTVTRSSLPFLYFNFPSLSPNITQRMMSRSSSNFTANQYSDEIILCYRIHESDLTLSRLNGNIEAKCHTLVYRIVIYCNEIRIVSQMSKELQTIASRILREIYINMGRKDYEKEDVNDISHIGCSNDVGVVKKNIPDRDMDGYIDIDLDSDIYVDTGSGGDLDFGIVVTGDDVVIEEDTLYITVCGMCIRAVLSVQYPPDVTRVTPKGDRKSVV